MKHDAGADIERELLAGDVDVDDVSELCGDGTAAVNYRKTQLHDQVQLLIKRRYFICVSLHNFFFLLLLLLSASQSLTTQ